ncbi:putative hemolysin [Komagataeibacter medellinensis]|nr:DUF333 domain-containing protein [Komagataeibacter medellinensis]
MISSFHTLPRQRAARRVAARATLRAAALALSGMLGGCGPAHSLPASPAPRPDLAPTQAQEQPAPQSRIGMANPASVYCQKRGGTLEMRHTAQGTTGWCHLPDGTVVEEWALWRSHHSAP